MSYHRRPSSIALQSKPLHQGFHISACSPNPWKFAPDSLDQGTGLTLASCLLACQLSSKSFFFSLKLVPQYWLLCTSGTKSLLGNIRKWKIAWWSTILPVSWSNTVTPVCFTEILVLLVYLVLLRAALNSVGKLYFLCSWSNKRSARW